MRIAIKTKLKAEIKITDNYRLPIYEKTVEHD